MADFDASTTNCRQNIVNAIAAYDALIAGDKRVRVRFNDRWAEYKPGLEKAMLARIQLMQAQCPDADQIGLVQMNPGLRSRRGRPARIRIT